jgi:hypothetical protein
MGKSYLAEEPEKQCRRSGTERRVLAPFCFAFLRQNAFSPKRAKYQIEEFKNLDKADLRCTSANGPFFIIRKMDVFIS